MIPISEKKHYKRLEEKGIVIEEKFSEDENEIYYRISDGSRVDDIKNLPKSEVIYYKDGKKICNINHFDENARYTFISNQNSNKEISCPNCGNIGKEFEFINGCPFCGSDFNMDYVEKKSTGFKPVEMIGIRKIQGIALLFTALMFIIRCITAQNAEEPIIHHIVSVILIPIFFFISYLVTSFLMFPICIYKIAKDSSMIGKFSAMIQSGVLSSKQRLYNDLNNELSNYYYDTKKSNGYENLIDFDILEYKDITFNNNNGVEPYIIISYKIRKIYFENDKVYKTISNAKVKLKKNNIKDIFKDGYRVIKCVNCGASIDVTSSECDYCHTPNNFKNEWTIEEFILDKK